VTQEIEAEDLLLFEVRPSFGPRFTASLVRHAAQAQGYSLRCALAGPCDPTPWEVPVSATEGSQLLGELAALRISPDVDFAIGLDGTTYRMTFTNGWNRLVLEWWGHIPAQWAVILPICQRMVVLAGPRAAGVEVQ